jgi:hypothetical protein
MSSKTWTTQEEQELKRLYLNETQDIEELGEAFSHKGYRSIISKLVQLKIYKKPEAEAPDKSKTVKLLLRDLERMLDIELDSYNLNKKENLKKLVDAIEILYNKR